MELKNQHRSSKQFLSLVSIYLMKNKVIKQDKGDENLNFQVNYSFNGHNIPTLRVARQSEKNP